MFLRHQLESELLVYSFKDREAAARVAPTWICDQRFRTPAHDEVPCIAEPGRIKTMGRSRYAGAHVCICGRELSHCRVCARVGLRQ